MALPMPITQNLMPMGRAAAASGGGNMLPPMPPGAAPSEPTTMNSAAPMPSPMPSFPAPSAPSTPPYDVKLQPDGSSIYLMNGANGPVVLGVNQAPKMPKSAMQPPQGIPHAMQPPMQ